MHPFITSELARSVSKDRIRAAEQFRLARAFRHSRGRARLLAGTAVAGLVLGVAACGSASPAHPPVAAPAAPVASASAVTPQASAGPALTQDQLTAAAVSTADVQAHQMGVTSGNAPVINRSTTRIKDPQCQPLQDVFADGGPDYTPVASLDSQVLEANYQGPKASHLLHLASFSGGQAQAFVTAVAHAVQVCHAYTQPDSSGPIQQTITPGSPGDLGDQSAAWHTRLSGADGRSYYATVTVVRVGSSVITGLELSAAVSSADQVPATDGALMAAQISKLRQPAA